MQYHGYEIDPEYIAKDAGVPDWHSAGLGEFVVGRKGGKRWFIKRNNEYRFPTEKEQPDKELRDYYLIPAKKYQADREALRRLMVEKGGLTAEKDHIVPEVEHFVADGRIVLVSQYVENIARDARNDALLRERGWSPVHFWEKEVLRDLEGCVEEIEDIVLQQLVERQAELGPADPGPDEER